MARTKTLLEKLNSKVDELEIKKEKIINRKIKEWIKSDPEIVKLDKEMDVYKKLIKKKEEQEKKDRDLENEITMFLEEGK